MRKRIGEMGAATEREIVEHMYVTGAGIDQRFHKMTADEPGAARHERVRPCERYPHRPRRYIDRVRHASLRVGAQLAHRDRRLIASWIARWLESSRAGL